MDLVTLRLLFDFGLLVLIWLVQLVIYPGLCHYGDGNLYGWHQKYTRRISLVVVPLMTGQLILSGIQVWRELSLYTLGSLLIIIFLWSLTFLQFVPLHNSIVPENDCSRVPDRLVKKNRLRTLLWSLLFFWTFGQFF